MNSQTVAASSQQILQNRSLTSLLSGEDGMVLQEFQKNNGKQNWKGLAKLLLAMGVPVVCLILVTSITLYNQQTLYDQVSETEKALSDSIVVTNFIGALQRERGASALYISAPNAKIFERLLGFRTYTDGLLHALQSSGLKIEFPLTITDQRHIATITNLKLLLEIHRNEVTDSRTNAVENIEIYTTIISSLIDIITSSVVLAVGEDLWKHFASITSLIAGSDSAGIQRALGSIYFSNCLIPGKGITWMLELSVQEEVHIKSAFLYLDDRKEEYKERLRGNESQIDRLNLMKSQIMDGNDQHCINSTVEENIDKALLWFDLATNHIDILLYILQNDIQLLVSSLNNISRNISTEFGLNISAMILVLIGSVLLSIWYVRSVNGMTHSLNTYTQKMSLKKKQISQEKRKTELLLYQMLPRHVADQLKQNKTVDAEYFSSVTVFFSDIVGFTSICAGCTPHQVVDLLSQLYSLFDSTIEKYDVYKVETIGDAYMVASGLPRRNGILHSKYIAEMSLSLLSAMGRFKTPNGQTLQVRIGLHSGAVVAGVVGIKMPRYCLFGDTVNIAQSLECTGKASKIHISEMTNNLMHKCGSFKTERRGRVEIKDIGNIETYWLLQGLDMVTEDTVVEPFQDSIKSDLFVQNIY